MRISDKERHEIAGKLRNLMPEDASEDFFASSYLFHAMALSIGLKLPTTAVSRTAG